MLRNCECSACLIDMDNERIDFFLFFIFYTVKYECRINTLRSVFAFFIIANVGTLIKSVCEAFFNLDAQ